MLALLMTAATGAWAQEETYPIVYDFEAAANASETFGNKNGSGGNGQGFFGWESADRKDWPRQDYKGYTWGDGQNSTYLPQVCHVWRRSDRMDATSGNISNGGLKCPSDKQMAVDGLTEGLTVTIIYDATNATNKEIVWAIGDGSSESLSEPRAKAIINGAEAVPGQTTIKSGDVITVNSVTAAQNGSGYIVFKVMKDMVIKKIIIDEAKAEPAGYTVSLKDGVKDADKWTVKVGDAEKTVTLPITNLKGGETVTLKYNGRLKVKGVKATSDAAPEEPAVTWNTVDLSTLTADYAAQNGDVLTGETSSYKVAIAAGATVTLDGVNISSSDYCIRCAGDATIILKDGSTNTLTSSSMDYPALSIGDANTTLTIQGSTGVLNVTSGMFSAGIGGGYNNANQTCGNIMIEGGVITAQGGAGAPGIGSDNATNCGNITITNGVTKVTAKKGDGAPYSIGAGEYGSCGTVTIGGTKYWENNAAVNGGDTYLAQDTILYPEP